MNFLCLAVPLLPFLTVGSSAFVSSSQGCPLIGKARDSTCLRAIEIDELAEQKRKLLGLVGREKTLDSVLADPVTKEPLKVSSSGVLLGGVSRNIGAQVQLVSSTGTYRGSSTSYINLLETRNENDMETASVSNATFVSTAVRSFLPLIPPPVRSALATAGAPVGENYVPMRDLFTSPAVSLAYERGWRQGFARAGFPGADTEAQMAMDYFEPCMVKKTQDPTVLVDMSCATGLFTRRFALSEKYDRVIGCDYSSSMLQEARRRIQSDPVLSKPRNTRLDLVRLDVEQIPMQSNSVNALHAGAAMHCWPDLPKAVSEIHRVLMPGGRYFATTFLSSYFGILQNSEGGATGPSRQAFQYFESVEQIRSLLEGGGFPADKISIEVLGRACVVIRCEK